MDNDKVRVIKVGDEALFEFIYENFIDALDDYFELEGSESLKVSSHFQIDWKNRKFIFCIHKFEDDEENVITFPKEIKLEKLLERLPDTTSTLYDDNRYSEFTIDELINLSSEC